MKYFTKSFICSCALVCAAVSLFSAPSVQAASSTSTVKVQVNDELIKFPEVQPFIDNAGTLQVPLRVLSEKLGYQVGWARQENDIVVTLMNKQQTIQLTTDEKQAIVNSKTISLESSPTLYQGNTYVPLRFITETFGSPIEWNEVNRIAIVNVDGKSHKPAWIAPPPTPVLASAPKVAAVAKPSVSDQIVQTANTFMGTPYVWGGTTPRGFDCSGFVRYLYEAKGIDLPRTSVQMYDQAGTRVTDLKVGDLVFFAAGSVNHVGIYLGNDQFISATTSRGVTIDSLASSYWGSRYVGAKRVL
ncbi:MULTISPECIES: C40 family peptidase [unclassified Paenibacillus]|uniref:C40 family peptidase n=1 Tax=unclassified Paenibacillus TaxID=185978 RepID=UPI00277F0AD1|nr:MULTISPECIES: NlpC/P60 family protein [unclassified Paenibacillus]MDQ0902153.1 peptidoglycan endopeptidase LytE [Paenibacillus sp. V4I7]MDQ0919353.1 peptidoglycan endopeptidase LytE [Paenibacillus sp. V4I5]